MNKVKKHKTCVGCFAHCIEFPFYTHTGGIAFCTLNYPVKSASINYQAHDLEAIPLEKCTKPTTHKQFCQECSPMKVIKK